MSHRHRRHKQLRREELAALATPPQLLELSERDISTAIRPAASAPYGVELRFPGAAPALVPLDLVSTVVANLLRAAGDAAIAQPEPLWPGDPRRAKPTRSAAKPARVASVSPGGTPHSATPPADGIRPTPTAGSTG